MIEARGYVSRTLIAIAALLLLYGCATTRRATPYEEAIVEGEEFVPLHPPVIVPHPINEP